MAYEGKRYSGDRRSITELVFYGILLCIPLTIWGYFYFMNGLTFDQQCEGHLERAAHSNSIETATEELETAVGFLEKNNLTEGYTTIFESLRTPDEDIGFWYRNLATSLKQLQKLPKDITPLERSNVLLKLHESLTANQKGQSIVHPSGVARYPHNVQWGVCLVLSALVAFAGLVTIMYALHRDD